MKRSPFDAEVGNLENMIKKVNPAFVDITKRLPGALGNFAQQQMSKALQRKPVTESKDNFGFRPHELYVMSMNKKGKK